MGEKVNGPRINLTWRYVVMHHEDCPIQLEPQTNARGLRSQSISIKTPKEFSSLRAQKPRLTSVRGSCPSAGSMPRKLSILHRAPVAARVPQPIDHGSMVTSNSRSLRPVGA